MVGWSCTALKNIAKSTLSFRCAHKVKVWNDVPVRNCHERQFVIRWTRFEVKKAKDLVIFYALLGALPIIGLITYVNIFIGPATLAVIPEGYDPKPWEYHRHPITRFIAKHFVSTPQENYERTLHNIFIRNEKQQLFILKKKVKDLIKNRQDYQSWYFDKPVIKYSRKYTERDEETRARNIVAGWIQ